MIKISEFSPSIASSSKNPQAKCKVVINNDIAGALRNNNTPETPVMYPTVNPENENINYETQKARAINEGNESLYKHLAMSFSNILKNNNPKLIANLIDMSGKVILTADDLVDAISLLLNIDRNLITISYEDPDAGCLNKINPIKRIIAIKVNGYDFMLGYNRQYNLLSGTFGVSLTSVLLGI